MNQTTTIHTHRPITARALTAAGYRSHEGRMWRHPTGPWCRTGRAGALTVGSGDPAAWSLHLPAVIPDDICSWIVAALAAAATTEEPQP